MAAKPIQGRGEIRCVSVSTSHLCYDLLPWVYCCRSIRIYVFVCSFFFCVFVVTAFVFFSVVVCRRVVVVMVVITYVL